MARRTPRHSLAERTSKAALVLQPLLLCCLLLFATNWAPIGADAAAYDCDRGYPISGTPVWDFDSNCNYSIAYSRWSSRSNPLNIQNATIGHTFPYSAHPVVHEKRPLYKTDVDSGRKILFPSINPSLYPNASDCFLCAFLLIVRQRLSVRCITWLAEKEIRELCSASFLWIMDHWYK